MGVPSPAMERADGATASLRAAGIAGWPPIASSTKSLPLWKCCGSPARWRAGGVGADLAAGARSGWRACRCRLRPSGAALVAAAELAADEKEASFSWVLVRVLLSQAAVMATRLALPAA